MQKLFLISIFLISSSFCLAQELVDKFDIEKNINTMVESETLKSALKTAHRVRKDLQKYEEQQRRLTPTDTKANLDMELCVECNEILKITNEVNKVLAKLPEVKDSNSTEALELDNLIAVTTIAEYANKNSKANCFEFTDPTLSEEFSDFRNEEMTLQFSEEIDTFFIGARFYNQSKNTKTVWLRGSGKDLNKVVRIDIDKFNNRRLSYYTLNKVDPNITVKKVKEKQDYNLPTLGVNRKVDAPTFKERTSGNLKLQQSIDWDSNDSNDYVRVVVGPEIKYKYYIPKDITVLKVEAENQVLEEFLIKSNVVVNDKSQEAQVSVVDLEDKKEVVRIKAKGSDANVQVPYDQELLDVYKIRGKVEYDTKRGETVTASLYDSEENKTFLNISARQDSVNLGVPYEVDVYDTYNVRGHVSANTLGTQRYTASVRDGNEELFNTKYSIHANGNDSIAVGSNKRVGDTGTLSLKFQRDRSTSSTTDSVWVNYEMKF